MKLAFLLLSFCPFFVSSNETNQTTKIKYLHVISQIQSRFAITLITSEVVNLHNISKEIFFTAQLPDAAFISNFSMKIDDKIIFGDVKEKQKAKQDYDTAVKAGKSAGLVAEKPRETNSFQISVNVAAYGKVSFNLTYQEMLKRTHGVYKHVINLQPEQNVEDLIVNVLINEQGEMKKLKLPTFSAKIGEKTNRDLLKMKDQENVDIQQVSNPQNSYAYITYKPTDKSGQLVVLYDIKRDNTGGHIEVMNGYFVHFFAPSGLQRGTKNIIFVLDKSGSMSGRKFEQTKEAMKTILNDLDQNDRFNILMFSDATQLWNREPVMATEDNKRVAIQYIQAAQAMGGTNIFDALLQGVNLLNSRPSNSLTSMVIFLTDGEATVGEMNSDTIVTNISLANEQKVVIHSLAFGNDADFKLVRRISNGNNGLARKVYEDSDAELQLTGFFNEISSPLLTNVNIKYLNETVDVDSLVQDNSYNYYDGGEFVVVGKLSEPASNFNPLFDAEISANAQSGLVHFQSKSQDLICPKEFVIIEGDIMVPCCSRPYCPPPFGPYTGTIPTKKPLLPASTIGGFIERMWAYQTIKKLLKSSELEADNKETLREKALQLSLKYKFVTELTSMVVIQPDQENATVLEEPETPGPMGGFQHSNAMPVQMYNRGMQYSSHGMGYPAPPDHDTQDSAIMSSAYEDDEDYQDSPPPHPVSQSTTCHNISSLMLYLDMTGDDRQLCWKNYHFVAKLIENLVKKADLYVTIRANTPTGLKKFKFTAKSRTIQNLPLVRNLTYQCTTNNLKLKGFNKITNQTKKSDAAIFIVGATSPDVMKPIAEQFKSSGKPFYLVNLRKDQNSDNDLLWTNLSPSVESLVTSVHGYEEVSNQLRCPRL